MILNCFQCVFCLIVKSCQALMGNTAVSYHLGITELYLYFVYWVKILNYEIWMQEHVWILNTNSFLHTISYQKCWLNIEWGITINLIGGCWFCMCHCLSLINVLLIWCMLIHSLNLVSDITTYKNSSLVIPQSKDNFYLLWAILIPYVCFYTVHIHSFRVGSLLQLERISFGYRI